MGPARYILAGLLLAAVAMAPPASLARAQANEPPMSGHACADFDSWIWAQSVFDAYALVNPQLDPDGDGRACPELPPGFAPALWTTAVPENAEPAELVRVVDGDTIEARLPNGAVEDVRLILIDTPETKDPDDPVECFGAEAAAFTSDVLTSYGGDLYLEKDVTDRDRYGRLLRYAWLDLGDAWRVNGRDAAPAVYNVNEVIARSGYASLSTYPPDVKYVDQVRAAVAFAREHNLGLWPACGGTDTPLAQAPAPRPPLAPAPAPAAQAPAPAPAGDCDPSYPTLCLPPGSPDLDCGDVAARRFPVVPPDPHRFDGDFDGVGCESG